MISRQEKIQLARQMVLDPPAENYREGIAVHSNLIELEEERNPGTLQGFWIRLSIALLIGTSCYMASSQEQQPVWYQQLKSQKSYLEETSDYKEVQKTLRQKYVSILEQYMQAEH